jgi:hypothetical protein
MKIITKFKQIINNRQSKILLGRWNIIYCEKIINKKIDLSNEDHCGTCNNKNLPKENIDIRHLIFFEKI